MTNMVEEQQKVLPVNIVITSYNRMELLRKTIDLINQRTFYPYRIIVVDNNSTDGSQRLLRELKVEGRIFDAVFMPENVGQCKALNKGFETIESWENNEGRMNRPSSDFFVTTNEDIYPPGLGNNCWLTQMIEMFERNEPEYGALAMRIQRTSRNEIDESKEIIPCYKGCPSVYRIMRRSDVRKLGPTGFGKLLKWESNTMGESLKNRVRKKYGFCTKIYADHAGFMLEKKGYGEDIVTLTVAENKLNERFDKPYPDIDPETNVPVKINHSVDTMEQKKREEYGKDTRPETTVIALTCHRADGLKRIIESVKAKTHTPYKLLVIIDSDDTEAYNYCLENSIECILTNVNNDFVRQANIAIYACDTKYFVVLGDDSEVKTDNWLEMATRLFKERFPDDIGLLAFNDNIQRGRIFTMGFSSKKFVKEIGGDLYFRGYVHFGGDNEVTRLARLMNAYHYAPEIEVNHFHWQSNPDVVKDATYSTSMQKHWQEDQRLKKKRREIDLLKVKNEYEY